MKNEYEGAAAVPRLEPLGLPPETAEQAGQSGQPPAAAVALRLASAMAHAKGDIIYVASSERRAEETARALAGFAPQADILFLPAWDCLPYDRAPPSSEVMGQRMSVLRRCLTPSKRARILVLAPEALVQKLPPADVVRNTVFSLKSGADFDRQAFEDFALLTGYRIDDRVDEPGEVALRGNVVEVFPADAQAPVRITDMDGTIQSMQRYDPRSQRSLDEIAELTLGPASELVIAADERQPAGEHHLAQCYGELATIFDYLPQAQMVLGQPVPERMALLHDQITEAHETARDFGDDRRPPDPNQLYLDQSAWAALAAKQQILALDLADLQPVPSFTRDKNSGRALAEFLRGQGKTGPVVLCGTSAERKRLASLLKRHDFVARYLANGLQDLGADNSELWLADFDLDTGFRDDQAQLTLVAAADVWGSRLQEGRVDVAAILAPIDLRVDDVVVHEDHGLGVLRDLTRVTTDVGEQDTIRLEYHGGTTMMVPVADFGKLWRYGGDVEAVSLDRLNTDAWAKKRASVSLEIDHAAEGLAKLAHERLAAKAEVLKPPKADYSRLAARFAFPESPDQAAAIAAVLDDLASGHPMNRLVCGDVGFGKTEVAMRAAAVAALCGRQVAVVAPTTVLARQHLQSFERRFAGTDIRVGGLSRLNSPAEAAATKASLKSGELRIVVATHAIVAEDVVIPDLGLVIIDEEQRFGAKLKRQVLDLAENVHLLSMSATPIPRSLQAAMVGLQDVSIIATPPARRRPIRTFIAPFDPATARSALLREQRRHGQSFVVVPRVADIDSVGAELARIVPDLTVIIAHGGLPAKQVDTALTDFANGKGDILLATNIVESGLDIPRANTMLVWRADRFGLSQLHQLRGRVGRGRTQGIAYMFTDPASTVAESTRARLSTLEAFDRLGSGFDISATDLEQRGAGDLLGEEQAGHVHLIGSALYQQLLEQALARTRDETDPVARPADLNLGMAGTIPVDYVPEAVVRINLYARLQRIGTAEDLDDFADEIQDRFGPAPDDVTRLLLIARLALKAGALGIVRVDAGPLAIALTLTKRSSAKSVTAALSRKPKSTGERIVYERTDPDDILADLEAMFGDGRDATSK